MNDSMLSAALGRHQGRREAGLPTVTVLVGPVGLAAVAVRRWAGPLGKAVVQLDDPAPERMAEAWATGRDLSADAERWLACRLRRPLGEFRAWLGRMTHSQKGAFLDAALDGDRDPAAAACRWLLSDPAAAGPGGLGRLAAAPGGRRGRGAIEEAVAALAGLIPDGEAPIVLIARRTDGPAEPAWIESAATSLGRLAEAVPCLMLVMAVAPGALEGYFRGGAETRTRALIRAGVVAVPAAGEAEVVRRLAGTATGPLAASARRLAADGASEELIGLFVEASRAAVAAGQATPSPAVDDPARSAAERFLFERLESLPETAGLFALNATLDVPFGPGRAMEVDLLARALGLAVEIDGYYHFDGPEAYRRDRRKDFELQKHGYLVVRVLASDVVARLEEVLDQILRAVAVRRAARDLPAAPAP